MAELSTLTIFLGATPVGILSCRGHQDQHEFRFHRSYLESYPRPILGQHFEDNLSRAYTSSHRLPEFFSNLLPEGALRQLVARQAGVAEEREFWLLAHLGEDLAGAVRALPSTEGLPEPPVASAKEAPSDRSGGEDLRFSLAGVQLKFSMLRQGKALVIPAKGQGGDWLVKLPDARYEGLPESEHSALLWAREAGIEVPAHELVAIERLKNLPRAVSGMKGVQVLALQRYDRDGSAPADRIHQEDFAQVLGIYPERRYKEHNHESIARILVAVAGEEEVLRFVDRIVFNAALGNGDAHHKNWSLLYPDGVTARLTPAYDLVPSVLYMEGETLALKLGKSREWSTVDRATFRRLARKAEIDEDTVEERARAMATRVQESWQEVRQEVLWSSEQRRRLLDHRKRVPLLQDR